VEAVEERVEVTLDSRVPLFELLADLCARVEARGARLRLVGGTAMLLWGRVLSSPRDMTLDLDCALLASDLPDPVSATRLAEELVGDLAGLGFRREADWRESRKGRFSYPHEREPIAVELLCGDVPLGRRSRREPAWQLATLSDGPPHFYAAHVPWLDFVETWVEVTGISRDRHVRLAVPDLAGLTVLKIRAVADKILRLEEERDPGRLDYERARLERHAVDCVQLFAWMDLRGEFARLASVAATRPAIRSTARSVARWILDHAEEARSLRLESVVPAVMRIVT